MKKWRILTDGSKFRIQQKSFLFWRTLYTAPTGYGCWIEPLEFEWLEDAEAHVAKFVNEQRQELIQKNRRRWKALT